MAVVKFIGAGVVIVLLGLGAMSFMVLGAASSVLGSSGVTGMTFSEEALADIPPEFAQAYLTAATACPGLPPTVIAAIGKVESNHGRFGGGSLGADGVIRPSIIGIPLDGRPGVMLIHDTDGGRLDRDTVYDRAVGPFQFLPSTWAMFERWAGRPRDPHLLSDAVQAVVWHLCPDGTVTDLEGTIFRYNRSQAYVDEVLEWAQRYTGVVSGFPVAGYALPLPSVTPQQAAKPHHDYPAWDAGVPVGTPAFAISAGNVVAADGDQPVYATGRSRCGNVVIIEGIDQVRYTYCHLSEVSVTAGDQVAAGQPVGLTGGQPGAPGAGNTTGPHLHLGMHGLGRPLCPQELLLSILDGNPLNPLTLPSNGCIS